MWGFRLVLIHLVSSRLKRIPWDDATDFITSDEILRSSYKNNLLRNNWIMWWQFGNISIVRIWVAEYLQVIRSQNLQTIHIKTTLCDVTAERTIRRIGIYWTLKNESPPPGAHWKLTGSRHQVHKPQLRESNGI